MKIGNIVRKEPDERSYKDCPEVVYPALIGVEVELEGLRGFDRKFKWWNVVDDGSLRNYGLEFVLKNPLTGVDLIAALAELEKVLEPFNPQTTERTSLHIHMDVRDLEPVELFKLGTSYCIFERALYHYCGLERQNNIFCLSLESAEQTAAVFGELISEIENVEAARFLLGRKAHKYSGMNLAAIAKYGSIEFRGHRGCWKANPILNWVNILLRLKQAARELPMTPDGMMIHISGSGPASFLTDVFKDQAALLTYVGLEDDIYEGLRLAQDIIFYKPLYSIRIHRDEGEDKHCLYNKFIKWAEKEGPLKGTKAKKKKALSILDRSIVVFPQDDTVVMNLDGSVRSREITITPTVAGIPTIGTTAAVRNWFETDDIVELYTTTNAATTTRRTR